MITQLQRIKAAQRIVVGLLFLFIMVPLMAQVQNEPDVWDGTTIADKLSTEADGKTSDNPIMINNAAELAYLAQQTNAGEDLTLGNGIKISNGEDNNSGFQNIYFALAKDIDLDGHEWTPIGINGYPFAGNFDGKGHCVSGLTVTEANYAAGLFGYALNNTIQNLGVKVHEKGIKATGKNGCAGGIAGSVGGTIRNCYVEGPGTVEAMGTELSFAGGIAGAAYDIFHCYATVDVKANGGSNGSYAGGIAGNTSQLSYTYATGNVEASGSNSYVGGICGIVDSNVSHNLALNKEVKGESSNVHRIAGDYDQNVPTFNYASPGIYVNGQPVSISVKDGKDGSEAGIDLENYVNTLIEANAPNEWSSDAWIFKENILPQLQMVTEESQGVLNYSEWNPNSPQPELPARNHIGVIKIEKGGDGGNWDNAIKISNNAELAYLARMVNTGGDLTVGDQTIKNEKTGFQDKHFILTNNIDLSAYNWKPIGIFDHPFKGNFDGKGHCVSGLTVTGANDYAGLFGYVLNNTIQNLGVKVHAKGIKAIGVDGNAGGIAGFVGGTIRNCYVEGPGTVKAEGTAVSSAGGIAGAAYEISHCYATVDVKASGGSHTNYAGGIVGNSGQFSYTYATGNVEALGDNSFAGGIFGYSFGSSNSSHNLALNKEVKGKSSNVHRIAGYYDQSAPTFNYASPQMTVNENTINDGAIDNLNGADTWLETFKEDLLKEPTDNNGWSDGKGWEWPDDASTLLPKLMVLEANGSYTDWPGTPAQPDIDAKHYLPAYPRLYIQTPAGITLTVTDAADANDTPIANDTKVDPGTQLKLSKNITDNNYSFNHYLYGTSADQINLPINGDTYVMPNHDLWISASVTYTEPKPEPTPEPPYVPVYYTVTLPQVDGATTDPGAGLYEVESWNTFRFYLTLDSAYSDSQPVVSTSRGETLTPRQSDGAYLVKYVRSDVEIRIDSIRPNLPPVANEAITAPTAKVWTANAHLHMQSPTAADAYIYAANGRRQAFCRLTPGKTESLRLPAGIYLIRIGKDSFKIAL